MKDYFQLMKETMDLRGYAQSTKTCYFGHLRRFSDFINKDLAECDYDDVRAFLLHAINTRKLSCQYINSAYSAIKFFYQSALRREWNIHYVPRLKRKSTLPEILTTEEVELILSYVGNKKHRVILSTVYSAGLRVGEVACLKIADIDSPNMRIHIRQAKGCKDRTTLLSERLLILLREYWKEYRPKEWLFPGFPSTQHLSKKTIQVAFSDALKKSGITKKVSVHSLRHAFATHSLNQGASILQIKDLLGHSNIQSTMIYLHLTDSQLFSLKSPFDRAKESKEDKDNA
jgi:integrase/recombinase XerD